MSSVRRQALIEAPVESIWALIGNPERHPQWWPRVIEVRGQRFEPGDQYVQVTRGAFGSAETKFLIERREENLHAIRMQCQLTHTYAEWVLTSAQGGTFVDLELGMQPQKLPYRVFDATMGPMYFRRWAEQSLDGLRTAVDDKQSAGAAPGGA